MFVLTRAVEMSKGQKLYNSLLFMDVRIFPRTGGRAQPGSVENGNMWILLLRVKVTKFWVLAV